jgi:serine/threonine protein kinase
MSQAEAELHHIAERFEAAWKRGERPEIDAYLAAEDGDRKALLVELVHMHLELRLKAGEEARVEDYLKRYPELAEGPDELRGLVLTEYQIRKRQPGSTDLEDYCRRFPQFEDQLRRQALLLHQCPTSQSDAQHRTLARSEEAHAGPQAGRRAYPGDEPKTIGRFRVQRLLGEGGFARVYLAYDPALDRQVAIKVPRENRLRSDTLRREAMVAAKLKHPSIVQIYEIAPNSSSSPQPTDPSTYVVMQYIEGTTLALKLEAEKVSLDYAVELMLDVAEAVAFAHGEGVLHRDLKPHNILLDVNDRPYVADFGLAIRDETRDRHIGEGCGTPAYMSPEQASGGSLTPASDIWSMGVILYELLVRQRPFGTHPLEVLRRLGKEDPVALRQLDSAVPQDLERICLKCLARRPADRYQSTRELITDLRNWQTYRAVGPSDDDLQKAEQYHKQAFASIDSGDLATAIDRLQDVVRLNPDSASACYLLGLSYLMTDRNVQLAIGPLRRATELNRDNDAANFLLANIYHEVKAYHLAVTFADQALATKPSNQTYRDFQRKVRDAFGSVSSAAALPAEPAKFDLEPARRRQLSEVAEAVFHLDKTRQLSLTHWVQLHHPWRLIQHRPLLGSVTLAVGLFLLMEAVFLLSGEPPRIPQMAVVWVLVWIGLYVPFVLARMLEKTYVRLLPAVNMPEDAFRRFFSRQSAYILGGSCGLQRPQVNSGFRLSWQINRPHLLIAAAMLPVLIALQCVCGGEPFWPITPGRVAFFATAVFQAYVLVWIIPLAVLCVFFIPRFYNVPVRYFLGMPAELSLGSVGAFYVRLSWLGCAGYVCFLMQHYLFRTYRNAPVVTGLYLAIGVSWIVSVVLITQYQLYRLLSRLKARKILEYSYHVESSFERVMKKPSEKAFEELTAHQRFMRNLSELSTCGLTREDLMHFLLIVVIVLGITLLYAYLVSRDIWLVPLR